MRTQLRILATERDINDERKRVSVTYDAAVNVALGAGDNVAVATYADGQKVEKPFSVAAGKRQTLEIKP
ncbi:MULTISPECIES: hypothetical protein [unclassified Bradyrhizobium]|uniref:hypothetical protein n=1 Tax=unclassified Bradyrhizobium TaxID=2631580 RepID=UPI0030CC4686